ncbi:DUF2849 domain-containing protein [Sphingosinicella sp. LHD-64]|uniref:DUF2849 domain-containing protein n=1 Tax=Sphingosinicella sp. LHD-64 TaxID=3072139 RepID=UPI00280E03A0|nr:DUF2849 domain-containing protein [Sphingosinicella sp. LHD-64]MDQ8757203.1 DUF2849 domain-containing protein [Sphingosinicella sp. LHD-64]
MSEQKSSKRPALPLVLTGNDLLSGAVVWFDGDGWTADPRGAEVAVDDGGAARLDAVLAVSQQDIVEPYLITVALDAAGAPVPSHYREKIRVIGPTFALAGAI